MAVWSVTSQPASEPLTQAEVKNYLRIPTSVTADDTLIDAMIKEARQFVERVTGRALITQTITEYFDSFPALSDPQARVLKLYVAPVVSITSLSYVPTNGTPASYTTWDNTGNSKYFGDFFSGLNGIGPARICKVVGVDWPVISEYTNAVKVVYVAGYGAASDIPGPLKRAMYQLISRWYYHPEDTKYMDFVLDLISPYKIHK